MEACGAGKTVLHRRNSDASCTHHCIILSLRQNITQDHLCSCCLFSWHESPRNSRMILDTLCCLLVAPGGGERKPKNKNEMAEFRITILDYGDEQYLESLIVDSKNYGDAGMNLW